MASANFKPPPDHASPTFAHNSMRNRIVGGATDDASLDEVFFYETDGQPVTFRQFNYSLEQEIGR